MSSRLALETVLIEWLEHGAAGKCFSVESKKSFAVVVFLDYFMDMITTGTGCVCMTAEGFILNKLSTQFNKV